MDARSTPNPLNGAVVRERCRQRAAADATV